MATRILESDDDRAAAITLLRSYRLPCTVSIAKGRKRSVEQNRLQRKWLLEAADQLDGYTPEELRAHCKLEIGVPLLREENEEFRKAYDEVIKPHPYEAKLKMMAVPLDFPVTRLMTAKQKTRYLDAMYVHFTSLGVQLTVPPPHRGRRKR